MSEYILIIILLFLIIFTIIVLFLYKLRMYKNTEEERYNKMLVNMQKEMAEKGEEYVKEGEEKAYLILKLRSLLMLRYFSLLNDKNINLNNREKTIISKEQSLEIIDKQIYGKLEKRKELETNLAALNKQLEQLELDINSTEYGLYKPQYDFIISQEYLDKLNDVRSEQKFLIKSKNACICSTDWTVNNSKREGNKVVNRTIKMMLLAFNGDCDSILASVTYKNILTMEKRLTRSYEKINSLNSVMNFHITHEYYDFKLQELHLVHEYQEKVYLEKEESRIRKQQIREEEKAQKEFEKELLRIEKEERRYKKALKEAKLEVETANKSRLEVLSKRIKELEFKLDEAEKNKRAISQAQITKCGFVYIISNLGAFGENVYKIGMTRRLNPEERIRELNGPSVPYTFDVHAMLFSENAPALELMLHQHLAYAKMNRINKRKEFFKISLNEIEECVIKRSNSEDRFVYGHEAKEFRLSEKIREDELKQKEG